MRYRHGVTLSIALVVGCEKYPGVDDELADEADSSGTEVDATGSDTTETGCPPESTDDESEEESTTEDSDGTSETDSDTTDATTGNTEDNWYVLTGGDQIVGKLMTPTVNEFALPGDMFIGAEPRIAHVVQNGYGFYVNRHMRFYEKIVHEDLYFTGPDCTGTGLDYFANQIVTDMPITSMAVCNSLDDLDGAAAGYNINYGYKSQAAAWLELNWPGAQGYIVDRVTPSLFKQWYYLPMEQDWPTFIQANSRLNIFTMECTPIEPYSMCAILFYPTDFTPGIQMGPFHLEQL